MATSYGIPPDQALLAAIESAQETMRQRFEPTATETGHDEPLPLIVREQHWLREHGESLNQPDG